MTYTSKLGQRTCVNECWKCSNNVVMAVFLHCIIFI